MSLGIPCLITTPKIDPAGVVMGMADEKLQTAFLDLVRGSLASHPEWMAATILAAQEGMLEAQERVLAESANVETGFHDLLTVKAVRSADPQKKARLLRAVEDIRTMRGSPWQEKFLRLLDP